MPSANCKQEAHALIDKLPDSVTWNDIAYHIEVRASIERGLAESEAGLGVDVKDLRIKYNLPE